MANRVTHLFSCPDVFARLAAASGAALVSWRQDGVGAGLRAVNAKLTEIVCVEDFAATGDVDDTLMIRRAAAEIRRRGGGTLWFKHGKTYTVWTSDALTVVDLSSTRGVTVELNGCIIDSALTNPASMPQFILASGSTGLTIRGGKFVGGNTTLTFSTGERFVYVGTAVTNLSIEDCDIRDCQNGLYIDGTGGACRGVYFNRVYLNKVFYPFTLYDTTLARASYTAIGCGRSAAIGEGCHDVKVDLVSEQGSALTDCIMGITCKSTKTAYENSITDVEITYHSKTRLIAQSADEALIALNFNQYDTGGGVVVSTAGHYDNIRIKFFVDCQSAAKPANLVSIRKNTIPFAPDPTGRGHTVSGLKISGVAKNCANLTQHGLRLFSTEAPANWTGDYIDTVDVSELRLEGTLPSGDAIYVNGQGAVALTPFLSLKNVYCDDAISYNNVTTACITEENVKASNLDASSVTGRSFTPTWGSSGTQPVLGSSTIAGRWSRRGRMVKYEGNLVIVTGGSYSEGTGNYTLTLPVAVASGGPSAIGVVYALDSGTSHYRGVCVAVAGASVMSVFLADSVNAWSQGAPFTPATGDNFQWSIEYPSA